MIALRIVGVLVGIFLVLPLVIVMASAFTSAGYVNFPPDGFSLKWFVVAAENQNFRSGIILSAIVALVASAVSTGSGMLIGRLVTKSRSAFAKRVVQVFTLPLLVPTLIFAVASLQFWTFFVIRLSVWSLVLGHIIITLPFAVRTMVVAYQSIDPRLEEAAASLGANQWTIFRRIVLRGIAPGIVSSIAFTALLSFDDVVVSLFLAPPGSQPLPVVMFSYLDQNITPALSAVSVVIMAISLALVFLLERTVGLGSLFGVQTKR